MSEPGLPTIGMEAWGDDLNAYLTWLDSRLDTVATTLAALEARIEAVENAPEAVYNSYSWQYSNAAPPPTGNQVRANNTNLALATMMKPGPFGTRTHELGTYIGVRREGQLAALAGERMHVPGFTEISAVCTHPEHTGHGHAARLMSEVMRGIRERGEIPMLHVRGDNERAITLYERLGFETRWSGFFAVLRKGEVFSV